MLYQAFPLDQKKTLVFFLDGCHKSQLMKLMIGHIKETIILAVAMEHYVVTHAYKLLSNKTHVVQVHIEPSPISKIYVKLAMLIVGEQIVVRFSL